MYKITNKQGKAINHYVREDNVVASLNAVYFTIENGKAYAVASNGQKLAYTEIESDNTTEENQLICATKLKKAIKNSKKPITIDNGNIIYEDSKTKELVTVNAKVEALFPNWKSTLPKDEITKSTYLDARLLKSICQSIIDTTDKDDMPVMKISLRDISTVQIQGEHINALVMPVSHHCVCDMHPDVQH